MSAAYRAAVSAALAAEGGLSAHSADPAALDAWCSLSRRCDRAHVSEAALAACAADIDDSHAAAARVLLRIRAALRVAGAYPPHQPAASATPARSVFASIDEAVAEARLKGRTILEAPRAFVRAMSGREPAGIRLLRAAFSDDDGLVYDTLAGDIDSAHLARFGRLTMPRPLRRSLRSTLAALGGGPERERVLAWADRLDAVRRTARKRRDLLQAAAQSAGISDTDLLREATEADRFWESAQHAADAVSRVALYCDSVVAFALGDVTFVPLGASVHGAALSFSEATPSPVDPRSFAAALGVDASSLAVDRIEVASTWAQAAATLLGRAAAGAPALAWPDAEPRARVTAAGMTFSASRLNGYVTCPRRWFFEYLCGAVAESPSPHATYGKAYHAALEALHLDVRRPADVSPLEVEALLGRHLDAAFDRMSGQFASALEREVLRLRARRVAAHYARWLCGEARRAPYEIVELESRQSLALDGHRFVGYIDRVDRPLAGGPVTIFDYKTGRIESDAEAYLARIRSGEEAQLPIYYAMLCARGERVGRMALISIRETREQTWALAVDVGDDGVAALGGRRDDGFVRVACTTEDLESSLRAISRRCTELVDEGNDHFPAGADPPCAFCDYASACRERPDDGERIFAR